MEEVRRLLGVLDGNVQPIARGEGGATVHTSKLLHAVTRMTGGTRYSLIAFFDRRERAGPRNRWSRPRAPAHESTRPREVADQVAM